MRREATWSGEGEVRSGAVVMRSPSGAGHVVVSIDLHFVNDLVKGPTYDSAMTAVTPLRRGPPDPDAAARIRERILDAATECMLAEGIDARLHAMIAERAGIS